MHDLKNIERDQPWDQGLTSSKSIVTFTAGIQAVTTDSCVDTSSLAVRLLTDGFLQCSPEELDLIDAEFQVLYFAAMRQSCSDIEVAERMVRLLNDVNSMHPKECLDMLQMYWQEIGNGIAYWQPDMSPSDAAWTSCEPIFLAASTWSALYYLDGSIDTLRIAQLSAAETLFINALETKLDQPIHKKAMRMYLEPTVVWLEQCGDRILDISCGRRTEEESDELRRICSPYRTTGIVRGGGMWSWAGGHDFSVQRWRYWACRLEELADSETGDVAVQQMAARGLVALREAEEKRGGVHEVVVRKTGKRIDLSAFVEPEIVCWGF